MEYNLRCNYCDYWRGGECLLTNEDTLLTSAQAAERLGVTEKTLWIYRDQGILKAVPQQHGRRILYRYRATDIDAFKQQQRQQEATEQEHQ